jgi:hypothetical protein
MSLLLSALTVVDKSEVKIILPRRMYLCGGTDDLQVLVRLTGTSPQVQTRLFWKLVLLLAVALPARGYHVFPDMRTSPTSGYNVVDAFGPPSAILADVIITGENGATGQRDTISKGDFHKIGQADYRGDGHNNFLRVQASAILLKYLRLVLQH